jgi:hypothetical protein
MAAPIRNILEYNSCRKTLTVDTINDHQNVRFCKGNECPFKKLWGVDCFYGAILSLMWWHVISEHGCELIAFAKKVRRDASECLRGKNLWESDMQF